jgi:hypothetical protein
VSLSRSRSQTPDRMRPLITVSTRLSVTFSSFDASTKIHPLRSPVRPSPDPVCPPGSGSPWTSPAASHRPLPILHAPDGDRIEHHPGSVLGTTSFMRPRVALIEVSVARRARRGLALWRNQGAEIRPMPAGGLSAPSCSEPGRSYRVSLAGEGRCGCPDWRLRKQPCKHLFAALVWAAKQRRALVLAGRRVA